MHLCAITESILRVYFVETQDAQSEARLLRHSVQPTETKMRRTILGALLITVSAIQVATASERHARRAHDLWDFRGSYNQLNEPSRETQERRNIENFGFSGRDPSRPGGWDPNLNPSGS
jgi:hypothetical protein